MSNQKHSLRINDYQWPSAVFLPASFKAIRATARRAEVMEREIESFFEAKLGGHAIVFPSARSALSMILRLHGFDRSHVVHVPKWVSHCLWDVVGRYSNPSVSFDPMPDAILAVHKWGQISRLREPTKALTIEDSVDSLIEDRRALFPNGGPYELFSLPKIIGSYCGGIVLTRDSQLAQRLRKIRGEPLVAEPGFAVRQSRLKFASAKAKWTQHMEWEYLEYLNNRLDAAGLIHVLHCLENYDVNSRIIRQRLTILLEAVPAFSNYWRPMGRLPPALPVPCRDFAGETDTSPMVRYHDFSGQIEKPDFEPAFLLPFHFGINKELFSKLMASAIKLSKKTPHSSRA